MLNVESLECLIEKLRSEVLQVCVEEMGIQSLWALVEVLMIQTQTEVWVEGLMVQVQLVPL